MAQVLAMQTMSSVAAASGRCTSAPRLRAQLLPAHARLVQRPFGQRQQRRAAATAARACRPVAFMGGPCGSRGPMGFGCGGAVRPEDLNRMAQVPPSALSSAMMCL